MFYKKTECKLTVALVAMMTLLTGCAQPVQFSRVEGSTIFGRPIEKLIAQASIPYSKTAEQFQQDQYDQNTTSIQFRVTQGQNNINGLKKEDLLLTEGGININNFQLQTNTESIGRKADIIFVIDDTGSMQPYIDALKLRAASFVQTLASSNIKANLCLVTFGDEVHSLCSNFTEDDPNTATNENLNRFLDALSRIDTDGGGDIPENQLAALIAAAQNTPWHADAQRIAILMTDADFHYSPGYVGDAFNAPTYQTALNSILSTMMMTFAVAPDEPGYSRSFNGLDAFPAASGGGWYDLDDIISGHRNMGDILNSIINQISVMYVAKFVVEDYVGLDPTLELTRRNIQIRLRDSSKPWTVRVSNISSNLPMGHPQYKKDFSLAANLNELSSVVVLVNNTPVTDYSHNGRTVRFTTAPQAGAVIRVEYYKAQLRDNLVLTPITFTKKSDKTLEVVANGFLLEKTDYEITLVSDETYLLKLKESLFDDIDPLRIAHFGSLTIGIFEKE